MTQEQYVKVTYGYVKDLTKGLHGARINFYTNIKCVLPCDIPILSLQ